MGRRTISERWTRSSAVTTSVMPLRTIGLMASNNSCPLSVKSVRVENPPPVAIMHKVSESHLGRLEMLSRLIAQEETASM